MSDDHVAGDGTPEAEESTMPQTSSQELEDGLFGIMITLVQQYMADGHTKEAACQMVADTLERFTRALRQQ